MRSCFHDTPEHDSSNMTGWRVHGTLDGRPVVIWSHHEDEDIVARARADELRAGGSSHHGHIVTVWPGLA